MNVLSLFDGLSGCRIALERIGVKPKKYYASEIDKYAIKVTQANYPDTIQLGSVLGWQSWDIDWASIDLVTGGFPCQAWSVAGKQQGDKDERGMLFWTMLDIMKTVMAHNPNAYFLIENVKMKKDFEQYITYHTEQALGLVHKHLINSALVSAQNRNRYYWTNIEGVTQPEDKGLVLRDVLEDSDVDTGTIYSLADNPRVKGVTEDDRGFRPHQGDLAKSGVSECGRILKSDADMTDSVIAAHQPKVVMRQRCRGNNKGFEKAVSKSPTVSSSKWEDNNHVLDGLTYRKLTPLECERLQTLPDNYTNHVSNRQRYKMIGNGWTIDVIAHILGFIFLNQNATKVK